MTAEPAFLELRTRAAFASVRVLNEILEVALRELAVEESLRHDVALGVAELVANVHEHEYRGRDGDVTVRLEVAPRVVALTVESQGPRFDPFARPEEAKDPIEELEAGGLGIPLLQGLFDEVRHDYVDGVGNRITLRKARA